MKKIGVILMSLVLISVSFSLTSCNGKGASGKLENSTDSLSYAYGVALGTSILQNMDQFPAEINIDNFLAVFEKAVKGDTASLKISPEEAYKVFQTCMMKAQKEAAAVTKKEGAAFLAENEKKDSVKTTESGLQYKILKEGTGKKPTETSKVSVNYVGTLMDGTVFDSSYKRGKPAEFQLNRVIKGWEEGIQLMSVGAKYKFWIPSDLAYGDNGAGGVIKPGSLLIFEVELLKIKD